MAEAVGEPPRVARLALIEEMTETLAAPRSDLSKYAAAPITLKINPERIGELIGPGGKEYSKRIVEESGSEINIEDDGTLKTLLPFRRGDEERREADSRA